MSDHSIFSPLQLPCGQTIPSRLAKAAMEEGLSEAGLLPGKNITWLYQRWAKGGAGLLITGNVMIDSRAMTGLGGIALEENTPLTPFHAWSQAAKSNGGKVWMQINHPGRQVYASLGGNAWSASDVAVDLGKHSRLFAKPTAMTELQICEIIERFAMTASQAQAAGFDGVQIHAAHGYLLSQFLSPITNLRDDIWGGSLPNRARLLIEIIRAVRERVSNDFAVSVKLNSADFQRGGFSEQDALAVVELLNEEQVDLVEISGGSYESPAMQGRTADQRTLDREAYFLQFAADIAKSASMPIMTTGGIVHQATAERVLDEGVDMVGIGRALAMTPDLPNLWQQDIAFSAKQPVVNWSDKALSSLAVMAMVRRQIQRLSNDKSATGKLSPAICLLLEQGRTAALTLRYRRWLKQQSA